MTADDRPDDVDALAKALHGFSGRNWEAAGGWERRTFRKRSEALLADPALAAVFARAAFALDPGAALQAGVDAGVLRESGLNVPQGTYRNHLGVEMSVGEVATQSLNGWPTLGADIAVAHHYDPLLGDRTWLVTEESLRVAGYSRVTADELQDEP